MNNVQDALSVLEEKNDARSLCFAAKLSWFVDMVRLQRSAELGYAFAQAAMAQTTGAEAFAWASRAALRLASPGLWGP